MSTTMKTIECRIYVKAGKWENVWKTYTLYESNGKEGNSEKPAKNVQTINKVSSICCIPFVQFNSNKLPVF